MSRELVRQIDAEHPQLLRTNIGATCHQFTLKVIEALRAQGHQAFLVCKSPGEGQYVPPGFPPQTVTGLDGKPYPCSGVSHDAIWCDGQQFDTIASANDADHPIFNPNGTPIVGTAVWNAIPSQYWRPNNPPLKDGAPAPPPPAHAVYPSYEELGGDAGGIAITRVLEGDYKRAGRPGLDADSGAWLQRVNYDFLTRKVATIAESIAKHRPAWCAALGILVE